MCALDLCNWYESHFPRDFNQLIKLKHYNIMDLSFTLNQIWDRLDSAEKLLMCAVYNGDTNLAKQLINSERVNPVYGKHYMIQNSVNKSLHSNRSSLNLIDYERPDENQAKFVESDNPRNFKKHYSDDLLITEGNNCYCQSFNKFPEAKNIKATDQTKFNNTHYLSHRIGSEVICVMSPFYLAIKLNNFQICKLFIENLRASYSSTLFVNACKCQNGQSCYFTGLMGCLMKQRKLSNITLSTLSTEIAHLNSFLSNGELTKLLCIALTNRNFQIATLILSNVSNPKQILNPNLSESFIYNQHFCLYLIRSQIIDAKTLLKEAIRRHATETTYFLTNQMENTESRLYLISLYKSLLHTTIQIGDINIFKMFLHKLNCLKPQDKQVKDLFVHKLIRSNYHYVLERLKQASSELYKGDCDETRQLATLKGIDLDQYLKLGKQSCINDGTCTVVMSRLNRFKLLKFLFSDNYSNENVTINSVENFLGTVWTDLEVKTKATISSYDRIFAATEYKENPGESDEHIIEKAENHDKRFYLGRYLVYAESEPFLVGELLKEPYEVTNVDLIQAAKSEISELTLYYLIRSVNKLSAKQMDPVDLISGNFLEIIFCRMVRCRQADCVAKLERLFFEAVVLKESKMTCSFNLLNLFVTESEFVRDRFCVKYFPILFCLNRSFRLFQAVHLERFNQLVGWFIESRLFNVKCPMSYQQIDLVMLGLFKKNRNMSDFTLKEMARSSCLDIVDSQSSWEVIDQFSDSYRHFIFFFNEIKRVLK